MNTKTTQIENQILQNQSQIMEQTIESLQKALSEGNDIDVTEEDRKRFPLFHHDIMRDRLAKFWNKPEYLNRFIPIITARTKISLRLVDWFVTNYAQKHKTVYNIRRDCPFFVHIDYKSQLNAWHKERFDPFCRKTKGHMSMDVEFEHNGETIRTTIGQLNFFKWAIEKKVIDYVIENFQKIDKDMNDYNSRERGPNGKRGTYITAKKAITKYNDVIVTVSFK